LLLFIFDKQFIAFATGFKTDSEGSSSTLVQPVGVSKCFGASSTKAETVRREGKFRLAPAISLPPFLPLKFLGKSFKMKEYHCRAL